MICCFTATWDITFFFNAWIASGGKFTRNFACNLTCSFTENSSLPLRRFSGNPFLLDQDFHSGFRLVFCCHFSGKGGWGLFEWWVRGLSAPFPKTLCCNVCNVALLMTSLFSWVNVGYLHADDFSFREASSCHDRCGRRWQATTLGCHQFQAADWDVCRP